MPTTQPPMKTLSADRDFTICRQGAKIFVNDNYYAFIGQTQYDDHLSLVLRASSPTYVDYKGLGYMFPRGLLPWIRKRLVGSIIAQDKRLKVTYKYYIVNEPLDVIKYNNRHYVFIPLVKFNRKESEQEYKVPRKKRGTK